MEVRATRTVRASPAALFAFLEEPDRHWQLLGSRLQPLRSYDGQRSRVRLRGPLGVRRTVSIELSAERPPHEIVGRVEATAGSRETRTLGTVRWSIRAAADVGAGAGGGGGAESAVELTARTDLAGSFDRLLLACGGTRWLRRSLELALAALAEQLEDPPA